MSFCGQWTLTLSEMKKTLCAGSRGEIQLCCLHRDEGSSPVKGVIQYKRVHICILAGRRNSTT